MNILKRCRIKSEIRKGLSGKWSQCKKNGTGDIMGPHFIPIEAMVFKGELMSKYADEWEHGLEDIFNKEVKRLLGSDVSSAKKNLGLSDEP